MNSGTIFFYILLATLSLSSDDGLALSSLPADRLLVIASEGLKNFTKDQLNHDFCDCSNGTDEEHQRAQVQIFTATMLVIICFLESAWWYLRFVYKVCPFKQAAQEEGSAKTRLGFDDPYRSKIILDVETIGMVLIEV